MRIIKRNKHVDNVQINKIRSKDNIESKLN